MPGDKVEVILPLRKNRDLARSMFRAGTGTGSSLRQPSPMATGQVRGIRRLEAASGQLVRDPAQRGPDRLNLRNQKLAADMAPPKANEPELLTRARDRQNHTSKSNQELADDKAAEKQRKLLAMIDEVEAQRAGNQRRRPLIAHVQLWTPRRSSYVCDAPNNPLSSERGLFNASGNSPTALETARSGIIRGPVESGRLSPFGRSRTSCRRDDHVFLIEAPSDKSKSIKLFYQKALFELGASGHGGADPFEVLRATCCAAIRSAALGSAPQSC
ncbi:MAG: hypothetical protein IPL38_20305 [Rhodobacter sp.]|nr:hypothetical protein [Rhodobacter sp.]